VTDTVPDGVGSRDDDAVDDLGWYDEATAARLRGVRRPGPAARPVTVSRGWRRAIGGGAIMTAAALGARDVFAGPTNDPVIEEIDTDHGREALPVVFIHVPGAPRASRVLLRPWLLTVVRPPLR
jgi:hypothetical protein